MNLSILIPLLIVLHVVPAVFWAGTTFMMARLGAAGADLSMRGPQMGAGRVAVLMGLVLFGLNHRGQPSAMDYVLGLGGLLAIAAMGVQEAVAWRRLRRAPQDPAAKARFALGQRIAAPLLVLALICMVTWRYA